MIDSVAAGYGLTGPQASRVFVDAVCKYAVTSGLALIVVEEALDSTPSEWSFSTDLVMELDVDRGDGRRWLRAVKNRFGPTVGRACEMLVGEHEHGVRFAPPAEAYLSATSDTLLNEVAARAPWRWGPAELESAPVVETWLPPVLLIVGRDYARLRRVALRLGPPSGRRVVIQRRGRAIVLEHSDADGITRMSFGRGYSSHESILRHVRELRVERAHESVATITLDVATDWHNDDAVLVEALGCLGPSGVIVICDPAARETALARTASVTLEVSELANGNSGLEWIARGYAGRAELRA